MFLIDITHFASFHFMPYSFLFKKYIYVFFIIIFLPSLFIPFVFLSRLSASFMNEYIYNPPYSTIGTTLASSSVLPITFFSFLHKTFNFMNTRENQTYVHLHKNLYRRHLFWFYMLDCVFQLLTIFYRVLMKVIH